MSQGTCDIALTLSHRVPVAGGRGPVDGVTDRPRWPVHRFSRHVAAYSLSCPRLRFSNRSFKVRSGIGLGYCLVGPHHEYPAPLHDTCERTPMNRFPAPLPTHQVARSRPSRRGLQSALRVLATLALAAQSALVRSTAT